MKYVSTRGEAPTLGFSDVLLAGLARDGGLYVPESWPQFSMAEIRAMRGLSYEEIAFRVMAPFVGGEINETDLRRMIDGAYATFRHPAVTPLVQLDDNDWVLELFHGPTLAFKDVAMQLLAPMMDHVLKARDARATVVGATSGDTGGAAIDAFKGRERVDMFILFPDGRVSDVQRRQMTTIDDPNVHALALAGTFDDAQAIVKALFRNLAFRDQVALSGVNSINWARIMAQTVYYFTSALALGGPDRPVSYSVPTGNFGDILAGYVARNMGLPIERLVVATNVNDILRRVIETGRYAVGDVVKTQSPSMDIQVSSNFERLLFDAHDRDAATIRRLMAGLAQSGEFTLDERALSRVGAQFAAGTVDEPGTARVIAETLSASGYLLDPHTAIGVGAAAAHRGDPSVPMVTLGTAHPAKFPEAVKAAAGQHPALPPFLADLHDRPEHMHALAATEDAVEAYIRSRARVVQSGLAAPA